MSETSKERHRLLREHRASPSMTSMDDWYVEVCKRNVNKLSVVEAPQPAVSSRPRSGSFKHSVKFVTGNLDSVDFVVLPEVGMSFLKLTA